MKKLRNYLILCFVASELFAVKVYSQQIIWRCTTPSKAWAEMKPLSWLQSSSVKSEKNIAVHPENKFQVIDGWGGCFNERGWDALSVLPVAKRNEIIKSFFDSTNGLKLNYGRTPIGCSDYSTSWYSYDETPGDYEMKNFSIDRDKQKQIPYIKSALTYRPDLKLWAVPWSAPNWMKDAKDIFLTDPKIQRAYALYFSKYVTAYKKEGVNIFMVMPENEEPNMHAAGNPVNPFWTHFSTDMEYDFVKNYLIPKFNADRLDCEIWLGTLHGNQFDFVEKCLNDTAVSSYIKGVGCQWSADKVMVQTHQNYPSVKLMQTETKCNIDLEPLRQVNTNDWAYAVEQWVLIKNYLNSWANSYMLWNMVLDETGYSITIWSQNSPVVVNSKTKEVTYTPLFYAFKHFSYYIKPGAHRIETTGDYKDQIAFENPNGDIIVEVQNAHSIAHTVDININGKHIQPALPARSWNTFIIKK